MQNLALETARFLETVVQKVHKSGTPTIRFIALRMLGLLQRKLFLVHDTRLRERHDMAETFFTTLRSSASDAASDASGERDRSGSGGAVANGSAASAAARRTNGNTRDRRGGTAAAASTNGAPGGGSGSAAAGSGSMGIGLSGMAGGAGSGAKAGGSSSSSSLASTVLHAPPPPPPANKLRGTGSTPPETKPGDDVLLPAAQLSNLQWLVRIVGWQYGARKTWSLAYMAQLESAEDVCALALAHLPNPDDLSECAGSEVFGVALDGLDAALDIAAPSRRKRI